MQRIGQRHGSIACALAVLAATAAAPVAVAGVRHRARHPHARRASAARQRSCQQAGACRTGFQGFDVAATTAPHTAPSASSPSPGRGSLHATQNVGTPLTCTGYTVKDPNWFNFYVGDTNPAGIGFSATLTVPDTDPGHVQVCFGSPSPFTARSGDPAKRATLPNGDPGFVGLLSHCVAATPKAKKKPLPAPAFTGSVRRPARLAQAGSDPCVLGITTSKDAGSTTGVDTTVTVSIPQGDPWMRA